MGLFPEYEKTGSIYNPTNDPDADTIGYPDEDSPSSTLSLHIIRLGAREQEVYDDVFSSHEANPDGNQEAVVKKSAFIKWDGKWFKVINFPEYLEHMQKTKIALMRIEKPNLSEVS